MTCPPASAEAEDVLVAFALSDGARVRARQYRLTDAELHALNHAFIGLVDLGHVAAYAITRPYATGTVEDAVADLRQAVGAVAADAVLAAGERAHPADLPHPEGLVALWDFDDQPDGVPRAAGSYCGLGLLFTAAPSDDEEVGVSLPGRDGLWVLTAATVR